MGRYSVNVPCHILRRIFNTKQTGFLVDKISFSRRQMLAQIGCCDSGVFREVKLYLCVRGSRRVIIAYLIPLKRSRRCSVMLPIVTI